MLGHLELLGRLHLFFGAFGVLAGMSLVILSAGTSAAFVDVAIDAEAGQAGVAILAICGGVLIGGGLALALAGRALDKRRRAGRLSALILAVPNLVIVPFGTALGVYTFWVLLNDEARREFGRPPRTPAQSSGAASA